MIAIVQVDLVVDVRIVKLYIYIYAPGITLKCGLRVFLRGVYMYSTWKLLSFRLMRNIHLGLLKFNANILLI